MEKVCIEPFVEKILYLIENPVARENMGMEGRKSVEEKYSTDVVMKQIERLYEVVASIRSDYKVGQGFRLALGTCDRVGRQYACICAKPDDNAVFGKPEGSPYVCMVVFFQYTPDFALQPSPVKQFVCLIDQVVHFLISGAG